MKADKKTALVVGANGIIGTNLINYLEELGTWDIIGLSRRGGTSTKKIRYIAVDLLDPASCIAQLSSLSDVTHIFYAAYQDRASWAELVEPNLAMLVNVLTAIEPVAANLEHVSLCKGTKFMVPI